MAISDLIVKYWYIFVILVVIIIYWMWKKLDIYTKITIRKIFSGKTLLTIAFIGGWYAWHKYGGTETLQTADRWMPVFLFMFFTGLYYIGKLRYDSQQFVCPNFHGSFNKDPYKVNGFYIFAIDSFNAGGLSWDYATRVIIVREETCELLPFGAISIASLGFVSKYELDPDVMSFIENNKFLKSASKECYYGWFDDLERVDYNFDQITKLEKAKNNPDPNAIYTLLKNEFDVKNPKVSTLYWAYRNLSKSVNKQTEYYDATVQSIEKGVEHGERVRQTYTSSKNEPPPNRPSEENY